MWQCLDSNELTFATMESKVAQYEKLFVAAKYYKAKDENKKDYVRTHE